VSRWVFVKRSIFKPFGPCPSFKLLRVVLPLVAMDLPVYVPDVVGSLLLFLAVGFVAGHLYGRSVAAFALTASLLYAYSNVPVFARMPIDATHLASYYVATALLGAAVGAYVKSREETAKRLMAAVERIDAQTATLVRYIGKVERIERMVAEMYEKK